MCVRVRRELSERVERERESCAASSARAMGMGVGWGLGSSVARTCKNVGVRAQEQGDGKRRRTGREDGIGIPPTPGLLIRKPDDGKKVGEKVVPFGIRTHNHSKVPTSLHFNKL